MEKKDILRNYIIGDRDFYRRVIAVVVPIIIQNTVTNIVSLIDNVMVGATGTLEMSAVAIVNQLLFVFYLCIFGGLSGAGIFSAQFAGARDNEGVKHCFRMKMYIAFTMLAVSFFVFLVFPERLISMYLAEDTAAADAGATLGFGLDYLKIMLIGIAPFAVAQAYGSTLRELGETKVPMIASICAIGVNVVFNYILIFGNKGLGFLWFEPMGVRGAAVATVMSRFVEAVIIIAYVHIKHKKFRFIEGAYGSPRIPGKLFGDIMKRGMPLLVNEFMWSFGMAILMQCYSVRGLDVVAASNISTTANNIFNVVFISMGNAIAIMVGQQLGAGKTEEAQVTVWRLHALAVATCIVTGGLLFALSPLIPHMYNTTQEIRTLATGFLRIVACMMPFYAFAHCCYFTLRSGGRTLLTLMFDCGFTWGVAVPLAFCLARATSMPILPLFFVVQLVDAVKCVVGFFLIKKGIWIRNIIGEE